MTFHSGMRKRNLPLRPSTPQAQTQAQAAPSVPIIPLTNGGTGKTTVPEARAALDVPSLSGANLFTGANTFDGETTLSGGVTIEGQVLSVTDGATITGLTTDGDPAQFTTGATISATKKLSALGGLRIAYVAKTADYTLGVDTDCVVDVTSGSPTITLPSAAAGGTGQAFIIKNSGAGTVTLATTSSQTIDGAAPGTVAAGGVIRLVSTGSNWISV